MAEVTKYVSQLMIKINPDGTVAGVAIDEVTAIDGDPVKMRQIAASSIEDERVAEIASAVGVTAAAEVLTLRADLATAQAEVERLTALVPEAEEPGSVPSFITAVQGRLILRRMGLLDEVEASVSEMNGETEIFWNHSAEWRRENPTLQALGASLGLSSDQIDEMFVAAKQIEAAS